MARTIQMDLKQREKALLLKMAVPQKDGKLPAASFNALRDRGLIRFRRITQDWVLSQKGQRWLAALEAEAR